MYYVLFNYTKDLKKDFLACRSEQETIDFLHENYKKIRVYRIIETARSYHLGLVVTDEYVKSVLEPQEETESLVPIDEEKDKQILKENKKTLEELEAGEPSAMSKIADDIEEEQEEETAEEKLRKTLDRGDKAMAAAEKSLAEKNKDWKLCTQCNKRKIAPWNKKGICSLCQNERKTTRPYTRSKEFAGL